MSEADRQLDELKHMLDATTKQMHDLVDGLDEEAWGKRPPSGGWSIAKCIQHLNITSRSYEESIPAAIEALKASRKPGPSKYRRDLFGWLLWKGLKPPAKRKFVTPPPYDPETVEPKEQVVAEWERLQEMLKGFIEQARGLDLGARKIVSPFNSRISYNLYAVFHILEVHQRRHLWQAAEVARTF